MPTKPNAGKGPQRGPVQGHSPAAQPLQRKGQQDKAADEKAAEGHLQRIENAGDRLKGNLHGGKQHRGHGNIQVSLFHRLSLSRRHTASSILGFWMEKGKSSFKIPLPPPFYPQKTVI